MATIDGDDAAMMDFDREEEDATTTSGETNGNSNGPKPDCHKSKARGEKAVSFLTLGDGDFTYSLDLARYLASITTGDKRYALTATGIDTRDELVAKYKDAPFIQRQLASAAAAASAASVPSSRDSNPPGTSSKLSSVRIRHGINAIVMPTTLLFKPRGLPSDDDDVADFAANDASRLQPADHVMFHHPHLATEDASLHNKFLCHLFHTVQHVWLAPSSSSLPSSSVGKPSNECDRMNDSGYFHLTLVKGQAERWKCVEAARDQGFDLVWRGPFVPPPPPLSTSCAQKDDDEKAIRTNYQLRRHQTGKSFDSRRPERRSESLIFQRRRRENSAPPPKGGSGALVANAIDGTNKRGLSILPWDMSKGSDGTSDPAETDVKTKAENTTTTEESPRGSLLACPHCEKVFREQRSLKCHLTAKHATLLGPTNDDRTPSKKRKKKRRKHSESTTTASASAFSAIVPSRATGTTTVWHCRHQCKGLDGKLRTFCSEEALQSHIIAKHSGLHRSIAPDWKDPAQTTTRSAGGEEGVLRTGLSSEWDGVGRAPTEGASGIYGRCKICRWRFDTNDQASQHIHDFTPPSTETELAFPCRFCDKVFREKRAQLQHENFCAHRNRKREKAASATSHTNHNIISIELS